METERPDIKDSGSHCGCCGGRSASVTEIDKMPANAPVAAGFADAVHDSQSVFNDVMQAMARPGSIRALKPGLSPPAVLTPCSAAVLLALADYDTTVWLDAVAEADADTLRWLRFHTGTKITRDTEQAQFAVLTAPADLPNLSHFAPGTPLYPDRSTTIIVQVPDLQDGSGWALSGPGIAETARLFVPFLPETFVDQWTANRARFPLGVDIIFCAPDRLACLPRTTCIEEG